MNAKQFFIMTGRMILLILLFLVLFVIGSMAVSAVLPDIASEPGPVPKDIGFLIFCVLNTLLIIAMIKNSRWYGWKLTLALAFAYYGAVTLLPQIETWYFLSEVTVTQEILKGLFIMGLPIAFIFIPLAVLILGKSKGNSCQGGYGTIGYRTALAAKLSGYLMLIFALSITFSTGIKGALDYSVFAASAAAFALSTMKGKYWELDLLFLKKNENLN